MDAQQINIAIAKESFPEYKWIIDETGCPSGCVPGEEHDPYSTRRIGLDYWNSLDAMHEAEKVLDKDQAIAYQAALVRITCTSAKLFPAARNYALDGFLLHATSQQRAEAFCRVKGIWQE